MLRPGTAALSVGAMLALLSAVCIAGSMLCVKMLSRTESSEAIVTYMVVYLTPMSLLAALPVWEAPSPAMWPWLIAMGALGTAGHLCVTRAFAAAEASLVLPFDYLRLPAVAVLGFVFFAEVPGLTTWIGAGLIAGASGYLVHREATLARAPAVAAAVELPVVEARR
jgi:drug/metabolite transporter (DMT)-like permease